MNGNTGPLGHRPAGRVGLRLTALGLGGSAIGNLYRRISDEQAAATIDCAWEQGVRYFDTAPHYGLGLSERRLGTALMSRPRDAFVVSTKIGRLLEPNHAPTGSDLSDGGFDVVDDLRRVRDYSRDGVLRSIEASLGRLGLDRIDIVYIHDAEGHLEQAITEAAPALVALREQGVVGAVGAGMNFPEPLRRLVAETDLDMIMLAGRWTLLDRSGETLLGDCQARGVSVVAAAPFNSGLLAEPWPADRATFDYQLAGPEMIDKARALADVCRQQEVDLPHAAIQFPLRHPAVVSVVCGMRSPREVEQAVGWLSTALPEPLWSAIDDAAAAEGKR